MTALLIALALAAGPPTFLAERVTTIGQQTRRVSVFRDGTAVVALRDGLGEPKVIRQTLHGLEMQVLLQVLAECYDDLARVRPPTYSPGGGWVEWRIAPPEREPLIVRLPQAGTPMAVVVRLAQALDGIENRLIAEPGGREDLSQWVPKAGERVLLVDGRTVEVRSVNDSSVGVLINVQVVDNPIGQAFTLEELRRQAVRRVAP
jgi:hypothetical protein